MCKATGALLAGWPERAPRKFAEGILVVTSVLAEYIPCIA